MAVLAALFLGVGLIWFAVAWSRRRRPETLAAVLERLTDEETARRAGDDDAGDWIPGYRYAAFIDEMWEKPGTPVDGIELSYVARPGSHRRRACRPVKVLRDTNGEIYVNLIDDGVRLTFNVGNGHDWRRGEARIDPSAFLGILDGADPDRALRADVHPRSVAEALANDNFATTDKRWIIGCHDDDGRLVYSVVSRVLRGKGKLHARCHLRWGARRTYATDRIAEVFDGEGARLSVEAFLRPQKGR